MKIRLRLSDADRERFDCPEWMDLDPHTVSMHEAIALQAGATVEGVTIAFDLPSDWRASLTSDATPRARLAGMFVLVWLALRRSGTQLPLSDVDFDADALVWDITLDAEENPAPDAEGKDESGPETTS